MGMYRLESDEPLLAPVLIQALSGWVDAGSAGTLAAGHLARDGELVATFDSDALFDYRSNRPVLDISGAAMRELTWPEVTVRRTRLGSRDVLVLGGSEPDLAWKEYASSVLDLGLRLGVTELISMGAVPAATPHTRPTPVIATASKRELLDPNEPVLEGALRVPSAAVSVVDFRFSDAGIPTVGFWAQVPHYVAAVYHAGAAALVRRVARHLHIDVPVDDLEREAETQRRQLDEIVAARPEAQAFVDQLEQMAAEQEMPSGDELAAEFERYLRDQPGGGGNPFEEGGSSAPG